jgi:cyclophilin family peptidyl-prolyl cis-trans isomerase
MQLAVSVSHTRLSHASVPVLPAQVVFGQVADGWQTLSAMEAAGTESGTPTSSITIKQCSIE